VISDPGHHGAEVIARELRRIIEGLDFAEAEIDHLFWRQIELSSEALGGHSCISSRSGRTKDQQSVMHSARG
jgi:hypothetical protein